ncbi:low temperature requirement protein A [Bradyrhizobium sp. 2TAF24]|uniref:low temperature requirement protein A n=1 Tax=Bradyrhizobium sp. 2TAF24 TaxID=3233011 RepID=UPI003F8E6D82
MNEGGRRSVLRVREAHQHSRVTAVELFFDLVFVFAVTQISHALLKDFSLLGGARVTVLFLAVWWVWIFTSWVTNWLDPDRTPVRILLFLLMLGGLVLSTSLPAAFDARGLAFGVAFAAMQVGRSAVTLWLLPASEQGMRRNFIRILAWLSVSGVLWIAGGLADPQTRLGLWALAVFIEYMGPVTRFRTPGLGASTIDDWNVEGGHMAERSSAFILIALGESVVVTGATFADLPWSGPTIAAFVASFVGSIAMWWIYFHKGAEAGAERISSADDPGRIARLAYTYFHMPMVAGIIMSAVADELVLAHPNGHTDLKTILSVVGGPLLFLIGTILFKRTIRGHWQPSHVVGIAALLALAATGELMSPLVLSVLTTVVLVVVAAWEAISLGSSAAPGGGT